MAKVGRPLKFKSAEEMASVFDAYFDSTPQNKYTVTGLVLASDMSKQLFADYGKREEFSEVIAKARLRVENSYELSLREHGRSGDIFALKNFGWTDKQNIEHTSVDDSPVILWGGHREP